MRHAIFTGLFLVFGALSACNGGGGASIECVDNADCTDGEACLLNVCEPVQCLSSESCAIREFCDTDTYVCRAGCEADEDCQAGESCNVGTNTCEVYGCRDTNLDCAIGEVCSPVSGQCQYAHNGHCDTCEPDLLWGDVNGSCQDRDAFCLTFDGEDFFCFQECTPGANDCPRGYVCDGTQDFDGDGRIDYTCGAYCPTLYANGWK